MNSRTVIEEPTAPPSGSSLKISASRAFSAPFLVLAPTVRKVRAVSPVTGSTWGLRGTPESRAAGAFSTPSFNRHCDRQSDRHLTDKTGLGGEAEENGAGCRRREKTRIRSSAWCLQKPQTSQNFEKPQVKPLITERSLVQIQPPRPNYQPLTSGFFLAKPQVSHMFS